MRPPPPPLLSLLRRRASAKRATQFPPTTSRRRITTSSPTLPGDQQPLMTRIANRPLPPLRSPNRWLRTLPIFLGLMGLSTAAIFNYQKQNSSVVASTMYALRTNPRAREILGEEIYFAQQIPWISGELNQLHGRIDIAFRVKGSKGQGRMRFRSRRERRMGEFTTLEWSLQPDGREKISLLETESGAAPVVKE